MIDPSSRSASVLPSAPGSTNRRINLRAQAQAEAKRIEHNMTLPVLATLCLLVAFATLVLLPSFAKAHHGWAWTTGGNIELTGRIIDTDLGYPHGLLTVKVNSETWTIEVGQPWRNERTGLTPDDLVAGVEIKASGQPSADIDEKIMKAERLWINGTLYDLYPNRD